MPDLKLKKTDEFFISMAKQGVHSFVMLGVMHEGAPILLARVGKVMDIEPSSNSLVKVVGKAITTGTLARIADEGLSRKEDHVADIQYQAYAINYEQFKEFLELIADIEQRQLENPQIKAGIIRVYNPGTNFSDEDILGLQAIQCFIPVSDKEGEITLRLKTLKSSEFAVSDQAQPERIAKRVQHESIAKGVQELHAANTCRTSALNIVEAVLGFVTDVSKYFFVSPKYQSQLKGGQPDKETFYILPPPPQVFKELSRPQQHALDKLYKRMEKVPILNPGDPKTRDKFEALKSMYNEIAGKNTLSATQLLGTIIAHENKNNKILFEKRSPNFLSELFSISSSTKKMFKSIKSELEKEKKRDEENIEENPKNSLS